MIAIIDYGTGNLRSVAKAFEFLGQDAMVSSDRNELEKCDKLVLPGVGAFGDCMSYLKSNGLDDFIKDWIKSGRHYLGICLGMQVLFDSSSEHGNNIGLGIIKGKVERFSNNVKVPQIGWNEVLFSKKGPLKLEKSYYYFVHSYFCKPEDENVIWATTNYGSQYCSAVAMDKVLAVQFHPEKSSAAGLSLLKAFARLA